MQRITVERLSTTGRDSIWSRNLIILVAAIFLLSLGTGLQNGINTNYMQELGLSDSQVLLQSGIREIRRRKDQR